jgi:hypothetical protein
LIDEPGNVLFADAGVLAVMKSYLSLNESLLNTTFDLDRHSPERMRIIKNLICQGPDRIRIICSQLAGLLIDDLSRVLPLRALRFLCLHLRDFNPKQGCYRHSYDGAEKKESDETFVFSFLVAFLGSSLIRTALCQTA